jgi:hAT family C-terminal dimerisation region
LAVQQTLPAILSTLEHFSLVDNSSAERSLQATSLLHFVNGQFAVQLVMFEKLLSKVNTVSKQLQSATCELIEAIDLVDCLKHDFADARSNCEAAGGMWSDIWKSAENIIKAHDLAMEVPVRRQRASDNRRLKDFVTTVTTGRRQVLQTKDDFRINVFVPVLDRMSSELHRRFADDICSIYYGVSVLYPGSKQFLDEQRISAMATHYQADIPDLSAESHTEKRLLDRKIAVASDTESGAMNNTPQFLILLEPYRDALYELYRLLVIACTLPATSAACERWFSKLKLIKTYMRNRMDGGRLSYLGIISLNAERATVLSL